MKPVILRVIDGGRITIPKGLRKKQNIREGDFVEVESIKKVNLQEPSS